MIDMIADHAGGSDLVIGGDFNLSISARQADEGRRTPSADLAIQRRLRDEFGLVNSHGVEAMSGITSRH